MGAEQANKLIDVMASKPKLKTLCGFSADETELDLSNKNLSLGCAVLVANEVKNNGAMAKFTFSGMVGRIEGLPVTIETSMTEADFSKKRLGASGAIMLTAFLSKCR